MIKKLSEPIYFNQDCFFVHDILAQLTQNDAIRVYRIKCSKLNRYSINVNKVVIASNNTYIHFWTHVIKICLRNTASYQIIYHIYNLIIYRVKWIVSSYCEPSDAFNTCKAVCNAKNE